TTVERVGGFYAKLAGSSCIGVFRYHLACSQHAAGQPACLCRRGATYQITGSWQMSENSIVIFCAGMLEPEFEIKLPGSRHRRAPVHPSRS
ncbi:MAG: hypothetical protein VX386_04250, partial [Pseudomonadota bacterium]|nr:hypothetical protein [Pseudomonadota bacterium]